MLTLREQRRRRELREERRQVNVDAAHTALVFAEELWAAGTRCAESVGCVRTRTGFEEVLTDVWFALMAVERGAALGRLCCTCGGDHE